MKVTMSCSYPARHVLERWPGTGWNYRPACVESARLGYLEHRPQVLPSRPSWVPGVVGSPGDLIQVSSDSSELRHRSLQCGEFLLGEGHQVPQVRADENRDVGGRRHTPSRRPPAQQDPIFRR
jgi:hypothetical protein